MRMGSKPATKQSTSCWKCKAAVTNSKHTLEAAHEIIRHLTWELVLTVLPQAAGVRVVVHCALQVVPLKTMAEH